MSCKRHQRIHSTDKDFLDDRCIVVLDDNNHFCDNVGIRGRFQVQTNDVYFPTNEQ